MQVRVGWSGEHRETGQWFKHDVELSDLDLEALAREHDFEVEGRPIMWRYAMLENEATLMLSAWVAKRMVDFRDSAKASVERCMARRDSLLGQAKDLAAS